MYTAFTIDSGCTTLSKVLPQKNYIVVFTIVFIIFDCCNVSHPLGVILSQYFWPKLPVLIQQNCLTWFNQFSRTTNNGIILPMFVFTLMVCIAFQQIKAQVHECNDGHEEENKIGTPNGCKI